MKKVLKFSLLFIIPLLAYFIYLNYPKLNILTGFAAKNVCSCYFEAGRELVSIEAGDVDFVPVGYSENEIHFDEKFVTSSVVGLNQRKAVYRKGIGCVLIPEDTSLKLKEIPQPERNFVLNNSPYPYGDLEPKDTLFPNVDYGKLQTAVEKAFDREGEEILRSRAVVVLYKDKLIAEKYAQGFTKETKLLGWSMTKSITNAVLGVLEKQGKLILEQDNLFQEWKGDSRAKITLNNLLQMNSGLEWTEDYATISDVNRMLFMEENMPLVQLKKPIVGEPGNTWNYSSGTSNLLSGFIRDQFGTHQEYINYWYREFVDKIGMDSMIIETDLAGNFVGSSYAWATARDWGKFGLLYLNNGNWNGEQILNESWVEYSSTPANDSEGEYGAHFWLNAGGKYSNVPKDLFSSNGFQGQFVFIIPSKDLVVVRLGLTEYPEFDVDTFLKDIIVAVE